MHLSRKKETILVYSHQPLRGSTFDIYATPDGRNVRSFSDNEYIKVDMKGEIFDRPNLSGADAEKINGSCPGKCSI